MQSYEDSKKDAFYNMITQKISQKLDSLPEIPCLSERWIWELIQNAKDSDSVFNKIKIKIEIHDNRFIFSHNGNPFILENLNSLVFHYSAKDEENKQDVETTGKYGTGFMVTYTVSKKVLLQCKFKGTPEVRADYINDEDEDQLNIFLSNKTSKTQQKKNTSKKNVPEKQIITNKTKNKGAKVEEKAKVEEPYYQDLNIILDRNYANAKQLKEKIIKIDRSVQKQLTISPKDMNYTRTEKSFDTCFIYGELDSTSFVHIQKGIESLKLLFPLVLLFNKKLFSIEVMNYSTKLKHMPSFKIVRQDCTKLSMFGVFNTAIYEMKKKKNPPTATFDKDQQDNLEIKESRKIQQYLYSQSQESSAIIAFPVQIVKQKLHLLKFPDKFPKIFKEFPLIGCEDLGFNFAFTSKQLYPSENRRQLILKQIPGRRGLKAEKNQNILINIFIEANDNYILLAKLINQGKANLLVVPQENNIFREHPLILAKMNKIVKKIYSFQIFTNLKGQKKCITNVDIIYEPKFDHSQSLQAYQIFNFLFPEALGNQDYEQLMGEFKQRPQLIAKIQSASHSNRFQNLDACVNKLQSIQFNQIVKELKKEELALEQLSKIYVFLLQNKAKLLFFKGKKIILNQQNNLCCYVNDLGPTLQLQVDFQDKDKFFKIAKALNISIKTHLIHQRFFYIFKKQLEKATKLLADQQITGNKKQSLELICKMKFQRISILNTIHQYFGTKKEGLSGLISTANLITLGQYLVSFKKMDLPILHYASKFVIFKAVSIPMIDPAIKNDLEVKQINIKLCQMFRQQSLKYIMQIYRASLSVSQFAESLADKLASFQVINYLHMIGQISVSSLPNVDGEIRHTHNILNTPFRWLQQDFSYLTDEDITIYDKFYQKCSSQLGLNLKPIYKTLIHPKIINRLHDKSYEIQFAQLFKPIKNYYNNIKISTQDKEAILNYTFNIYEEYVLKNNKTYERKYNLFIEIINDRHLEFGKLLNKLNNEDKDLICKVFKMKDKFKYLRDIINNFDLEEVSIIMKKMSRQK